MKAFEVCLNGKQVCVAGADDLSVLTTIITAVGKLGNKTVRLRSDDDSCDVFFSVSGLTGRSDPKKDVHVRWKSTVPLRVGDVIQVRVLEAKQADRAVKRTRAK